MSESWFDVSIVRRFLPGDAISIVVFVVVGELVHRGPPWEYPLAVSATAGTFLLGWALVSPLGGAYRSGNESNAQSAIGLALLSWLGADAIAQGLRATTLVHGNASISFFVVAGAFGGALLAGWRYVRVKLTAE
ncbi:MAG: DUF3054 domain-containing protein [Halodesulfurarchaeum sp.]